MDCSARRRLLTGHVTHAARQPIRLRTADCAGVVFGVSKLYSLETHDFRDGLQRRTGVAYNVPEREFLTGHLYGHPAPKRAVDPSNDAGVSVQRPAIEECWISRLSSWTLLGFWWQ